MKLNIDYTKHVSFSKKAEKLLRTQLIKDYGKQEAEKLMEKVCRIYEGYLTELPYSGGKLNPMWNQIYDSLACFAYYEAVPEPKPSIEKFEQTFVSGYNTARLPGFIRPGKKLLKFIVGAVVPKMASKINPKVDSGEWSNTWKIYTPTDIDGLTSMGLVGCPIADFARKHGFSHLMPVLCNSDYDSMRKLNVLLVRPRTVMLGYGTCDYYLAPLTPENEAKYPIQRTEDGFILNGVEI